MTRPNGYHPHEEDEQRLRAALRRTADQVHPSADGLERIRARVQHQTPWFRRPVALALAGATATAGLVVAITLVLSSTSPSSDPSGDASPSTTADNFVQDTALPVYYAVDGPGDQVRLAREFHLPETSQPIRSAIADMIRGAHDPDYETLWRPETTVHSAELKDDVIVVDLGDPAVTTAAKDAEHVAVQQLVYTATAAASAAYVEVHGALPVRILVDGGEPPPQLRKQLGLGDVEKRAPELEIRQLVQIDNPGDGRRTRGPVTISGSALAFEATLRWTVRGVDGTVVKSGNASAEQCCKFSAFTFDVELEPGDYVVTVSDTDPSDGEGNGVTSDTKRFTVTPFGRR